MEGGEKRLTKDHISKYALPMNTDSWVVKAWGGVGTGWMVAMGGGNEDICNTLNNKN